ncbi:MAG: ATP-binding protein [Candidatus Desulfatibia sp.]|uniref:ATP-binding protein n=1 Tax=Candidatus Desulfatibia sp. TaxID=3101189 RepID=UPI002F309806
MHATIQELPAILEAMADGIYIVKPDYTIQFMNKAMVKDFGEGTGKKCYQIVNRKDEKCRWCRAADIFEGGATINRELYIPIVDKTYDLTELPWINTGGQVSKLAIFHDITTAKACEVKLKATEQDYQRLFEHMGCGVFISSREGKFIDANQTLVDMLGYASKQELLEIDIARDLYLWSEDRKKFQELIESSGRVVDYEVNFKRKDGQAIPVLLTGNVRYDQDGNILGYEGINVDQSQRKQIEKELEKTRIQLLQTEKMASLGKLAAGVAHQLNNPLGGITLFAKIMMEEYDLEEGAQKDLDRILKDAQRCSEIVKELLEFSRQTSRNIQPHDINKAVSRTLFLLENQTLFHNIQVQKNLDPTLPHPPVDIQQMNHVFMNIILNAADAMEGNGKLTLETYRSLENMDKVCIKITDTGPGIPADILPHIFEPFFTTKQEGKGTGLGLGLAYGIVEDHGGSIRVNSTPGQGATFTIEIPLTRPENGV